MTFEFRPGKRESVSLLIGLAGGTGSGKTYSAMRIAEGLAGGERFAVIDTEAGRANHYADAFAFDHGDLKAPFTPSAYADAIAAADAAKYPVIVVDSASHEHAGDGGLLDMQEAEFQRMGAREAAKMSSWIAPKREHKRMVQRLLQVRAHVILCFRAEEKIELVKNPQTGKTEVVPKATTTGLDGWIPIAEKTLPYELTISFLLTADAPGIPKPIKIQEQHRSVVPLDKPLSQETGKLLGEWAHGSSSGAPEIPEALQITAELLDLAVKLEADVTRVGESITANALEHEAEPKKHLAWLKRQRKTMQESLAKKLSPFQEPLVK